VQLIPYFIEAGFDILNPRADLGGRMDPQALKDRFGEQLVFWGGGVDTQQTLPFGTPDEIRAQVRERMRIFGTGGGFCFQHYSQRAGAHSGRKPGGPCTRRWRNTADLD